MTSVYRQLKTEDCNAKVTEHFSVHVLKYFLAQFRQFYEIAARDRVRRLAELFRDIRIRCKQKQMA